jgi:hypothetical protein
MNGAPHNRASVTRYAKLALAGVRVHAYSTAE